MKDRFGYTEFNQVIHRRSTARDVHGHSTVTTGYEDAYVVLEDIGDDPGSTHGGLQVSLLEHISGAWLKKPGTSLPDWVIRGTGLALARQAVGGNQYIDGLQDGAVDSLQGIEKPEDVEEFVAKRNSAKRDRSLEILTTPLPFIRGGEFP